MSEKGPAGQRDEHDEDEDDDEGAVTELALNWLADQHRPGPKKSAEDMVVRVDVSSATAARDRALQAHLERQEMLKKAQVTPPWARKPLTVGTPFSTKKHPLGKKAKKKKKKAVAKKKAVVKRAVARINVESLAIDDYDRLTAAQVLSVLDQLDDDDLDMVGEYEEQHRNRSEILDAIDALFEEPEAPPVQKKAAAKKAVAKKAVAKKAVAKKVVAKRAVAKKTVAKKAVAKKAVAKKVVAGPEVSADADLPIENYDTVTVAQILLVLDDLDDDDLDLVAEYESEHQNRSQILDAIDDLLEEPSSPPLKRTFVKKAPVKKAPVKKVAAKKVTPKKVPAKKVPAKKAVVVEKAVVAEKVPAKKAVVAKKVPAKKAGARKSATPPV